MPTIRELLEGKELSFAALSPAAKHVEDHLSDPLGATKEGFTDLSKKKLQYDMARENMQRQLAMPQAAITHMSLIHGLQPDMPTPALGGGQPNSMGGMDPNDPNAPPPEELDENGQPIGKQQLGPDIPPNMDQTPGKMNMNRPTMVGHQPGVAPMMEKQVVPPKLGMASPGKPQARNSPAPNSQGNTYNRQAAPPKGNRSVPGAKGPGDPKVANRSKKAFGKSQGTKNELDQRRPIKVTVHASASPLRTVGIGESLGLASLKFHASIKAAGASAPIGPGGALGPSSVMPGNVPATGQPTNIKGKRMKALDELSDKVTNDPSHDVAYNPAGSGQGMKGTGHGTSHGAKKGWSTRGKGHLSAKEKSAHHSTLDLCTKCGKIHAEGKCMKAGGPGSGRHAGFGSGLTHQVIERYYGTFLRKVSGPHTKEKAQRLANNWNSNEHQDSNTRHAVAIPGVGNYPKRKRIADQYAAKDSSMCACQTAPHSTRTNRITR
jgi:hypothetical protein